MGGIPGGMGGGMDPAMLAMLGGGAGGMPGGMGGGMDMNQMMGMLNNPAVFFKLEVLTS